MLCLLLVIDPLLFCVWTCLRTIQTLTFRIRLTIGMQATRTTTEDDGWEVVSDTVMQEEMPAKRKSAMQEPAQVFRFGGAKPPPLETAPTVPIEKSNAPEKGKVKQEQSAPMPKAMQKKSCTSPPRESTSGTWESVSKDTQRW